MARTREFDETDALERAMHLFWAQGYGRTSVRDLVRTTGVAHAGLYAAFGGKRGLFDAALARYADAFTTHHFGPLEADGAGRAEIEAFFASVVEATRDGRFANGCLMAATANELGGAGEVPLAVGENLARQVRAFANALGNARGAGEVADDVDVDAIARGWAVSFHGLSTLARAGVPLDVVEGAVAAALTPLGPASPSPAARAR